MINLSFLYNYLLNIPEDSVVFLLHHQVFLAPLLLLTLEESGIPLPVPGDIIITFVGYQVSKGVVSYLAAFLTILTAVLVGSSLLYYLASRYGQALILKISKFIDLDEKRLSTVEQKFRKYGPLVIIFGRHIPGFRIPITIFAGVSNISYLTFISSTFISVIFWIVFYLSLGGKLGRKTVILLHAHHGYTLFIIIPAIIILLAYLFLRIKKVRGS